MDIGEIRRINMLKLIDGYKKQAQFSEAIGKPPSYISQIKKGVKKNGEAVSMGSDFARDIENSLGLPHGWMDVIENEKHVTESLSEKQYDADAVILIGGSTNYPLVKIPYLDIKASCGPGYVNEENPEAHTQSFTVEFLRNNSLPTDGKGLILMHACSDSMGYTIPHGTLMLVNTNESEYDNFINNKIYVFNADGEMICKRAVKSLDGSVVLKSDNADKDTYPDQIISRDTFSQFRLFGRVRYTFAQH